MLFFYSKEFTCINVKKQLKFSYSSLNISDILLWNLNTGILLIFIVFLKNVEYIVLMKNVREGLDAYHFQKQDAVPYMEIITL